MGSIEIDKCDFCKKIKPVERTYLKPSNYVKDITDYRKLYNDGDYFIIIKTCINCGIPKIN